MSGPSIDEGKPKDLLKTAITEVLEERKDLVSDLLEEALEDIGLVRCQRGRGANRDCQSR